MKLNIIKHQNNHEVKNYSKVLTTVEEINRVKNSIFLYLSVKKQNIITRGLPYEELNENGFRGFVSEHVQVVRTNDIIDITYEGGHVQYIFSNTCETTTLSLAA